MFRYITSAHYLTWLQANMLDPNGDSQVLALSIKKYVTILQILDPSSEFSLQFLDFMRKYQYFSILPQLLNLTSLTGDFNQILNEVFQEYIKKYENSTVAKMATSATALKAEIQTNNLKPYQDTFHQTVLQNAGGSWPDLVDIFKRDLKTKLGEHSTPIAELYTTGISAISIIYVINGTKTWADMNAIDRASFVTLAFSLFEKYSNKIVLENLTSRQAFIESHSSWSDTNTTYLLSQWKFPDEPSQYFEAGYAKCGLTVAVQEKCWGS